MINFKDKIEKLNQSHAYTMGVGFFNTVRSPFDPGSTPDKEWMDGFLDAAFLRIGGKSAYSSNE